MVGKKLLTATVLMSQRDRARAGRFTKAPIKDAVAVGAATLDYPLLPQKLKRDTFVRKISFVDLRITRFAIIHQQTADRRSAPSIHAERRAVRYLSCSA